MRWPTIDGKRERMRNGDPRLLHSAPFIIKDVTKSKVPIAPEMNTMGPGKGPLRNWKASLVLVPENVSLYHKVSPWGKHQV